MKNNSKNNTTSNKMIGSMTSSKKKVPLDTQNQAQVDTSEEVSYQDIMRSLDEAEQALLELKKSVKAADSAVKKTKNAVNDSRKMIESGSNLQF